MFRGFVDGLSQFGIPAGLVRLTVAVGIIGAELIVIGTLVLPQQSTVFRLAPATVLLAAFSIGVAVARSGNSDLTCRCFGSSASTHAAPHLVVNLVLIALGLAGILIPHHHPAATGTQVFAVGLGLTIGGLAVTASPILEAYSKASLKKYRPITALNEDWYVSSGLR